MTDQHRRSDWTLIIAVGLIVVGAWLLAGQLFGNWWEPMRQVISFIGRIAWPLMIILLGVLLIVAGRRGGAPADTSGKRLYRSRSDRMVSGVLSGFATYIGMEPTLLRIVYVVLAIVTGFGPALLLYIIATVIVPEEPLAAPPAAPQWPTGGQEYVQQPPPAPQPPTPPAPPAPPQG